MGEIPSYTNRLFYICLCELTQYCVSSFQLEALKLERNLKVVGHEVF